MTGCLSETYLSVWVERWAAWRRWVLSFFILLPLLALPLQCTNIRDSSFNAPVLFPRLHRDLFAPALLLTRLGRMHHSQVCRCASPACLKVHMNTHDHSSEQDAQTQQRTLGEPLSAQVHPQLPGFAFQHCMSSFYKLPSITSGQSSHILPVLRVKSRILPSGPHIQTSSIKPRVVS